MVRAVGFSHNDFNPAKPGRLCRGRERWIEPWSLDDEPEPLQRLVVSGAAFEDDSARDALRGIDHAGLDLVTVLTALYPRREFLAFAEDGHPADIPEDAENVELYDTHRAGGREMVTGVRWTKRVTGVHNLRVLLGGTAGVDRVRGFAVLKGEVDIEAMLEPLFLLVGLSTLDSPPARFQPLALLELLDMVEAIVLVHRDKHGHALGVYTREPIAAEKKLRTLTDRKGALLIPFAIPPMLARWDRALAEARSTWDEEADGPFPVPESDRPYSWDRRRKGRRRRGDDDTESGDDTSTEDADDTTSEEEMPDEASLRSEDSPKPSGKAASKTKKAPKPDESVDLDDLDDLLVEG